jgi:hypothetical protein
VIQGAIGTRGQITMGGKGLAEAQDLALVLRAGALPVPLRVAQVQSIGPTLGQDSIDKGFRASLISVVLVVIIMIVYYRFSGLLAGRRFDALHAVHACGAGRLQRCAHIARNRRLRPLDRYRRSTPTC